MGFSTGTTGFPYRHTGGCSCTICCNFLHASKEWCKGSRAESGGQKVLEDTRATLKKRCVPVNPTPPLRSVQPHSSPLCNWDQSWGEIHFWHCQQMCPSPFPSKHPDRLLISVGSYRCKCNSRTELLSLSHPKTVRM